MDVKNCKGCGRLFNYLGGVPLCPACVRAMDDKFQDVKQYIYDNPNASIQQVSEEKEVSIQQLRTWVREEKLQFSEESLVGLNCEMCGTMVRSGRFCSKCKEKMASNLGSLYHKEPEPTKVKKDAGAKMRFLDN